MRWSYKDWGFFADFGAEHFEKINEALIANIDGPEEEFESRIDSLWTAVLNGFQKLEKEGFFGSGAERSKITLLLVGDLPSELVEKWVSALNPADVPIVTSNGTLMRHTMHREDEERGHPFRENGSG